MYYLWICPGFNNNPRRACARVITVLGLCVCVYLLPRFLPPRFLPPRATMRLTEFTGIPAARHVTELFLTQCMGFDIIGHSRMES